MARLLRASSIAALGLALAAPAAAQRDHAAGAGSAARLLEPTEEGLAYTVRAGDTLSEIAAQLGVSMDAIVAANPDVDIDHIREGQQLQIETGLRRVVHRVVRGQSLSHVARRWEVRVADLLEWNRGLRRDRVREGRELVVFTRIPSSRSQSVGHPQAGRLRDGRRLPSHPAILVRRRHRAYGTDESVRWILDAFEAVRAADRDAPRVEVHDLSLPRGGPINGHASHESGRDADIAYYRRGCRSGTCRWGRVGPEQLDVEHQWQLFRQWLEHDRAEAIFMDYSLQRALYEHARSVGTSARDLSRWFQYPRDIDNRYGVIRHHPRHADHFHVRFVCHSSDSDCH